MKRGQVTIYIIVGIFLLILSAFTLYVTFNAKRPLIDPDNGRWELINDVEPVRIYVQQCLKEVSKGPITQIALNGGRLDFQHYRYHMGDRYQYLCLNQEGSGCVNALLMKSEMEEEIADEIESTIFRCLNLEVFRKQGFRINEGILDADVQIGLDDINIVLEYPLEFRRNKTTLSIDKYSIDWNVPLGKLYRLATNIVNQENSDGYFDAVNWTYQNDAEILIEKHRPYPDTIYSLKKENYTFRFALEGPAGKRSAYGCCYIRYDNNCYKNVPRILCDQKGGIFDPARNCECPILDKSGKTECNGESCADCAKTYDPIAKTFTAPGKKHGESWCNTDAEFDYVGSRHYLHFCMDGKEYVEECTDFREGICGETTVDGMTRAMCRPNRWQGCGACESKNCCEQDEYRDCIWQMDSCTPRVPPGFRFWDGQGLDTCSLASSEKDCQGFTCGDNWVTQSSRQCYSAGDCGDYRNYVNILTEDGFMHTDLQGKVNIRIYSEGNLNDITPYTRATQSLAIQPIEQADQLSRIIKSVYSFLESLSNLRISDYYNNLNPSAFVFNVGLCSPWKAPPTGSECNRCDDDPLYPCTEYRCMSLGEKCTYDEPKGVPRCMIAIDDGIPPTIEFNTILPEYDFSEDSLTMLDKDMDLVNINDKIRPYRPLTISLTTSEEAICRMSYTPDSLGGIYVGGYGIEHNLSIRVPPRPEFPQKLLDLMNATDSDEFTDLLFEARQTLAELEDKESALAKVYGDIFGDSFFSENADDLKGLIKMLANDLPEYRDAFKMITKKIEEGGYFLFFTCKDKAGDITPEPLAVEVIIDENVDEDAPMLLGTTPENNTRFSYRSEELLFTAYLSEPAECDISLGEDYVPMDRCAIDIFDLDPRYGGSYVCSHTLNSTDMIKITMRCKDNPVKTDEIEFNLTINPSNQSENLSVSYGIVSLEINASNVTVSYYMDDPADCSAVYSPGIRPDTECSQSDNLMLGQYMCVFDVNGTKPNNVSNAGTNTTINLLCNEQLLDRNEADFEIVLTRAEPLEIIDYSPTGEVTDPYLNVTVTDSPGLKCVYYRELGIGDALMEKTGQSFFAIPPDSTPGDNTYYIACSDDFGNRITQMIYFYYSE